MSQSLARAAENLVFSNTTPSYTQAVSMQGANAVLGSIVTFTLGGATSHTATLQGSNDNSNWAKINDFSSVTTAGYTSSLFTAIAWQYVRLKFEATGAGNIIVSADISTAAL